MPKTSPIEINTDNHICKNCETEFKGNYCPNCGQSIREFDKPIRFLVVDLMGNMFAFDTRFWKSLVSLIIRPGTFTSDYLNGHRARYMPPFRLYVFISFIFFLILSFNINKTVNFSDETKQEISSSVNSSVHQDSVNTDSISSGINLTLTGNKVAPEKLEEAVKAFIDNPNMYINSFLKFVSWAMFILMPLYAGILWLFYRKSKGYYYSHLILSINQHSFIFLLFILIFLIKLIFPERSHYPENYLLLSIPVYSYIGTLQLYKRRWQSTLIRTTSAIFVYAVTLLFTILTLLAFWIQLELI